MGEISVETGQQQAPKDQLHVLVTGFGPWDTNTVNPSFLIARAINSRLDLRNSPVIHVHTLSDAVPVSYEKIRAQIPNLLFPPVTNDPPPTFDLILFIGLAGSRDYYAVERRAFRDGYLKPDGDGEVLDKEQQAMWKQLYGAPEMLTPRWDPDDVWRRWRALAGDLDVRVSDDAGRFACEFIYFTGLVEYWRRGRAHQSQVAFLHVPAGHEGPKVKDGVRVAETLIKAMVESEMTRESLKASRI